MLNSAMHFKTECSIQLFPKKSDGRWDRNQRCLNCLDCLSPGSEVQQVFEMTSRSAIILGRSVI